jgi:hypothetical protein
MHEFLGYALTNWDIFWVCTAWTFAVVILIWVIGLFQGNHSMMGGITALAMPPPAGLPICSPALLPLPVRKA